MSELPVTPIGIIGCGNISKAYFERCGLFPNLSVVACADADPTRAAAAAEKYGVRATRVEELLAADDIRIVVNLTIPQAHREIDEAILRAGKHVFSEKPFALDMEEGRAVVAAATSQGLRIGCAPDTVLGSAVQTCRALVDAGAIGEPVAFAAAMQGCGHEHWHPSPEFYYQRGGGPMFDMGPYYLHALITLLGPVRRVAGLAKISFPERLITSQPKNGAYVSVEVPTHITSLLEFASGVTGTLVTSFDLRGPSTHPVIEIYGSEGTLRVPDPNGTNGTPQIGLRTGNGWQDVPLTHPYAEGSRGLGVADLAAALAGGRDHRANERIALHALEIMEAVHVSSRDGRFIDLATTCERPAPMRTDLPPFVLES